MLTVFVLVSLCCTCVTGVTCGMSGCVEVLGLLLIMFDVCNFRFVFDNEIVCVSRLVNERVEGAGCLVGVCASLLPVCPFFIFAGRKCLARGGLVGCAICFFLVTVILCCCVRAGIMFGFRQRRMADDTKCLVLKLFPLLYF